MNEAFLRGLPGGMGPFIKREPGDGKKDGMKARIPSQVKINEEDLPPEEREKREKERRWVFFSDLAKVKGFPNGKEDFKDFQFMCSTQDFVEFISSMERSQRTQKLWKFCQKSFGFSTL